MMTRLALALVLSGTALAGAAAWAQNGANQNEIRENPGASAVPLQPQAAPPEAVPPGPAPADESKPAPAPLTERKAVESPAAEGKPPETPVTEMKPSESPPAGSKPAQSPVTEITPPESPAADAKPLESPVTEIKPPESPAADAKPLESPVIGTRPAESPAAESKPPEAPAAENKPAQSPVVESQPPPSESRYTFSRVQDGYVRLDNRTGQVSFCSKRTVGWTCQLAPEDRGVLEAEIARLQEENAVLKKDLLKRGLPLPGSAKAEPPTVQDDRTFSVPREPSLDRMMTVVEKVWRRLVDLIVNLQKDVLKKS